MYMLRKAQLMPGKGRHDYNPNTLKNLLAIDPPIHARAASVLENPSE